MTENVVELAVERMKSDALVSVSDSGFGGNVRAMDGSSFVEGDYFTVTGNETIYKRKMDGATDRNGNPVYSYFALVETHNINNDLVCAKQFFITSLAKAATEYDVNSAKAGIPRPSRRVTGEGTLNKLSQKFVKNQDLWEALKGKTLIASKITQVFSLKYRAKGDTLGDYANTNVIDWNEKA